ncbi:MAG: homoserine O-succinyltransferase [Spirochaetaceae bacterium]|jgi:homoserine O-succinyltransferase|nr:homoserine O-succinyltransferase [Spirochaetaceae bacterium]
MPIKIPRGLPAYDTLTRENVFVMTSERAETQDIRPLKVAIANLMPTTIDTEIQLLRLLGNTPIQIDISLIRMSSHESHNAPEGHLEKFYVTSQEVLDRRFDGIIVTGAPVETLPFEEVDYWDELCSVFDWADKNVYSSLHICWGAQAGLYHRYGIPKRGLPKKLFGIFPAAINEDHIPLFRGFDDEFLAPQSRHTEIDRLKIAGHPDLTIRSATEEVGAFIVTAKDEREIYVTGHLEYDPFTLDREYKRDAARGEKISPPANYYPNNCPVFPPVVRWRSHAHLFFRNWIGEVYQGTPFNLDEL